MSAAQTQPAEIPEGPFRFATRDGRALPIVCPGWRDGVTDAQKAEAVECFDQSGLTLIPSESPKSKIEALSDDRLRAVLYQLGSEHDYPQWAEASRTWEPAGIRNVLTHLAEEGEDEEVREALLALLDA